MPRTVVYFTDSRNFGGSEQILLTMMTALDRQSWDPILVSHAETGLEPLVEKARELNIPIWTVPRIEGYRAIFHALQFAQRLRRNRPDIFHANMIWPLSCAGGLFAAFLARVPVVVATEHLPMALAGRRWTLLERFVSSAVDCYLAVSHHIFYRLRERLRLPEGKVKLVRNGIPLDVYSHPSDKGFRATLNTSCDRPIVLTVARLDPQKGHRYLIEAAVNVPGALFLLAGDGPERSALEAKSVELGLSDRVVFLGHRHDVPDFLAMCDLFVLPSLYEGLPLSVLEAMAAGKPVVATDIEGTSEAVVHQETGLLVPPANPLALAEAIRALLSDSLLSRQMGQAGKNKARRDFSAEVMMRQIADIYEELLSDARGSA